MDARAINTAMVMILLDVLYSAYPHEILSVLPENPNISFPAKFFPLKLCIHLQTNASNEPNRVHLNKQNEWRFPVFDAFFAFAVFS